MMDLERSSSPDGSAETASEPAPPASDSFAEAAASWSSIVAWVQRNRAKLEILAIGAIAVGGIVCMCLATLVLVWRMNGR